MTLKTVEKHFFNAEALSGRDAEIVLIVEL